MGVAKSQHEPVQTPEDLGAVESELARLSAVDAMSDGPWDLYRNLGDHYAFRLKAGKRELTQDLAEADTTMETVASVGGSIMTVARGVIIAVVALIVLSALYATDIVSNPDQENAWTNMTDTFADYGTTAFTLIGVGLIAIGASVALSYFGSMGGGGGR